MSGRSVAVVSWWSKILGSGLREVSVLRLTQSSMILEMSVGIGGILY